MSKENNLHDFLVDLAAAVRKKKGTSEPINAQNLSEEIRKLPSGEAEPGFASVMYDGGAGIKAVKAIIVRQGTTSIAEGAYSGTGIESLEIPSSVTTYGKRICKDCVNLKTVLFPENLTFIPAYFFQGCLAITSYTVDSRYKRIEEAAFYSCKKLKEFEVLGELDAIGGYAFEACINLKYIRLKKVISIGSTAFFNLNTTVIIDSLSISTITSNPIVGTNFRLYVPDEVVESYKSATNWSSIASKIYPLSEYQQTE